MTRNFEILKLEKIDTEVKVGGLRGLKRELNEVIQSIQKYPQLYARFKLPRPQIYLFYGSRGVGKTLIGRYIAQKHSMPYIHVDNAILNLLKEDKIRTIIEAFDIAKKNAPCVVNFTANSNELVNPLSSIGYVTDGRIYVHDVLVSQLKELKASKKLVFFILETQRPDIISTAIKRLIDEMFYVPRPDNDARYEILKILLEDVPMEENLMEDLRQLARNLNYCTGSDLKTVYVRNACLRALGRQLERKDFKEEGKIEEKLKRKDFEGMRGPHVGYDVDLRKYQVFAETMQKGRPKRLFRFGGEENEKGEEKKLIDEILDDDLYN